MRYSLIVRIISIFLVLFLSLEVKADGGEVLERIITLPKTKGTVYTLLQKVSAESGYLFIYDSSLVPNDTELKIKAGTRSLRQAIYEILRDEMLELKVVGNHILITLGKDKKKSALPSVSSSSETTYFTMAGKLMDSQTGEPISNASILIQGTSTGNVTNQNGEFKLHLPDTLRTGSVVFSHLGYVAQSIEISTLLGRTNVLSLKPKIIPLQEVLIRLIEPKRLLRDMLNARTKNYLQTPVYLTTFYREGVQLKNKFQQLTEGVFKVYKPSLLNTTTSDQVKLLKMSRINNQELKDSLAIKISAGIKACLELDIVKHLPDYLLVDSKDNPFEYTSGDVASVGDRSANVISFQQREEIRDPLLRGELYIDSENNALLQARMEINPKYVKKSANLFVTKSVRNVYLIPQEVVYTVTYQPWENAYYVQHIRGDLYFKSKRKKYSLSSTTFHVWFEMVTCKVEKKQITSFPRADRLPTHTILSELNFRYDESFWKEFNVIPLEEELSKIIEKISSKVEKIEY